jgi:hypothetical protein
MISDLYISDWQSDQAWLKQYHVTYANDHTAGFVSSIFHQNYSENAP